MKKAIGVDIGGTMTLVALVDEKFDFLSYTEFPTPVNSEEAAAKIIKAIDRMDPEGNTPCSIAVCGLISFESKKLLFAPNLGWRNLDFEILFKDLNREFIIINDGSSAAWGCYVGGKDKKSENLLTITMGTGVGGGIVLNGTLLFGASEIGHIKLNPEGPKCGCGSRGCLETYIGGKHIPDRVFEWKGLEVETTRELFNLAEEGDSRALESWKKIGEIAGYALAGIVNLNGFHKIMLGGTVASVAGKFFLDEMKSSFTENLMDSKWQRSEIIVSNWKKDVSLLGAAAVLLVPPANI